MRFASDPRIIGEDELAELLRATNNGNSEACEELQRARSEGRLPFSDNSPRMRNVEHAFKVHARHRELAQARQQVPVLSSAVVQASTAAEGLAQFTQLLKYLSSLKDPAVMSAILVETFSDRSSESPLLRLVQSQYLEVCGLALRDTVAVAGLWQLQQTLKTADQPRLNLALLFPRPGNWDYLVALHWETLAELGHKPNISWFTPSGFYESWEIGQARTLAVRAYIERNLTGGAIILAWCNHLVHRSFGPGQEIGPDLLGKLEMMVQRQRRRIFRLMKRSPAAVIAQHAAGETPTTAA